MRQMAVTSLCRHEAEPRRETGINAVTIAVVFVCFINIEIYLPFSVTRQLF